MQVTYNEAMVKVYADEGGYSDDAGDPGGPTNYGITIADARKYWKANATAQDVRAMPKSVAADIYAKHYATPLCYNDLPPGVDYAVLDYGINSGNYRSAKVLQQLVGVTDDGVIGPATIAAVYKVNSNTLINEIYKERLNFLESLGTWHIFGKGWTTRCTTGKALALQLAAKYPKKQPVKSTSASTGTAGAVVVAGGAVLSQAPHLAAYIIPATIAVAAIAGLVVYLIKNKGK